MSPTFIKIGALKLNSEEYTLPSDRVFREAWSVGPDPSAGVISVDMPRAREIWRDKIRLARAPKLVELDIAFSKAMRRGEPISDLEVQLQALLDAPADPAIELATTPADLQAVQPAGLAVE